MKTRRKLSRPVHWTQLVAGAADALFLLHKAGARVAMLDVSAAIGLSRNCTKKILWALAKHGHIDYTTRGATLLSGVESVNLRHLVSIFRGLHAVPPGGGVKENALAALFLADQAYLERLAGFSVSELMVGPLGGRP